MGWDPEWSMSKAGHYDTKLFLHQDGTFPTYTWESHGNGIGPGVVREREYEWELLYVNGNEMGMKNTLNPPADSVLKAYCVILWPTDKTSNCTVNCIIYL